MDELFHYLKKCAMLILLFPLRIFPVQRNRVVFHNSLGYKYAGNPKAVAEYLLSTYPGQFELIYTIKHPNNYEWLREKGIKPIRDNSFRYFYYTMTATVILSNSGGYSYLPLRKKQYIVNTWHGAAYKKCGICLHDSPVFRKDLLLAARKTDVFLSTSSQFSKVMSDSLLVPRELFWEIGIPRNDCLLREDSKYRQTIRKKIGLKEGERLVLFAPTFRRIEDNYFKSSIAISYGIDCARVCGALEKRFGGTWRFAFRLHPRVTNRDKHPEGNIIDLSDYEDMQDLLCAADILINDFSSSMWDFMLTGRPSFLFAKDLEHYIETTDVYTPVEEWPFPKAINNDELVHNILKFDEIKYAEDCKRHYIALGGCETGKASKLVGERIYKKCFLLL